MKACKNTISVNLSSKMRNSARVSLQRLLNLVLKQKKYIAFNSNIKRRRFGNLISAETCAETSKHFARFVQYTPLR